RDQVRHDLPAFVAGGDVVEDQLVGAVVLVLARLLDRIAGIDMIEELDALDHAAAVDVEARDDSLGQHSRNAAWRNEEGQPARCSSNPASRADCPQSADQRVIDGARTRDIQDHNLALYQLSYDHRRTARA